MCRRGGVGFGPLRLRWRDPSPRAPPAPRAPDLHPSRARLRPHARDLRPSRAISTPRARFAPLARDLRTSRATQPPGARDPAPRSTRPSPPERVTQPPGAVQNAPEPPRPRRVVHISALQALTCTRLVAGGRLWRVLHLRDAARPDGAQSPATPAARRTPVAGNPNRPHRAHPRAIAATRGPGSPAGNRSHPGTGLTRRQPQPPADGAQSPAVAAARGRRAGARRVAGGLTSSAAPIEPPRSPRPASSTSGGLLSLNRCGCIALRIRFT